MMRWLCLGALVACTGSDPDTGMPDPPTPREGAGLVGDHLLNPFPVGVFSMTDGALTLDPAPFELAGTALPFERLGWRSGFSPGQTAVLALPDLDPSSFPSWQNPTPGEGSVRLLDLTDNVWLPAMAELDAHPDAEPTLLVRPMVAMTAGHEVAVVVMTDAAARPERFDALLGADPPADLAAHAAHFQGLIAHLEGLGVEADSVALAWDFPIGDGTLPMRSVWTQTVTPSSWSFDTVRNAGTDTVVATTWRAAEGTFQSTDFLIDDLSLQLAADGSVSPTGIVDVPLYVHIPESVADAPAGSVPVILFGHGIFGHAEFYLDDVEDPSNVVRLAEESGSIVVMTLWRGLSYPDRLGAVDVAGDFGRMHELTDRLVQGQANQAALLLLMREGGLFEDPVFQGASGQPLVDSEHISYYGISLGGIEGAVMLANDPGFDAAVLHVGGSTWSTMLERSSNWTAFELFVNVTVPDPLARQRLYAVSQLWWDAADPIAYTEDLAVQNFLLQESRGDEQVSNMTTRTLARSIGLSILEPAVEPVYGIPTVSGPLPPGSRALVQFDPEVDLPEDSNRPAFITMAHDLPRLWDGTLAQTLEHLDPASPGRIVHHCGDGPCTASNPGQ